MNLAAAPEGMPLRIIKLSENDKTGKLLHDLGFTVGERVTVMCSRGGNVIVKLKEGRLAIDRTLAESISISF